MMRLLLSHESSAGVDLGLRNTIHRELMSRFHGKLGELGTRLTCSFFVHLCNVEFEFYYRPSYENPLHSPYI